MLSELDQNCTKSTGEMSLNPCCNGICSRSRHGTSPFGETGGVLILVVMEYALGEE